MNTVVVVTNAVGNVSFVFADLEKTKAHLRCLGYHPIRDNSHGSCWYDIYGDFAYMLTVHEVLDV